MERHYDVGVVGGGPAGAWLARELAGKGIKTLLCERSAVSGEPNFSTAGMPALTVERFGIPRAAIGGTWNAIEVVGPTETIRADCGPEAGYVLDFRRMKQLLLAEAEERGATVLLGTAIEGITRNAGGIIIRGRSSAPVGTVKIVVDASGPVGVIATAVGLRKQVIAPPSIAIEIIANVPDLSTEQARTLGCYLGEQFMPHGYGWAFPMGGTRIKLGVGVYRPSRYDGNVGLETRLQQFLKKLPWLGQHTTEEHHGGMGYLTGGIRRHVRGNIIVIGDAADQINPLGGEGIRHALQSASFAARVIMDALHHNEHQHLLQYERLWKNYIGWRWLTMHYFANALYGYASDFWMDRFVRCLGQMQPRDVFDLLFEYRLGPLFKQALLRVPAKGQRLLGLR